ncbi:MULTISPECIES: hypothetical protein [Clostridium]|jgi:hypothetical protein|uniref:Uncharacterized protein n=2 Tax=root TaxID=1 RepID=R9C0F2_9CLOT|nr:MULTISPECIES: hypothetical protein [Clostridium]EOR20701.1 hypothetical protein A500_15805 [Clostridium sartagoforme AAU1]KLE16099.1 hypothetical protein AAT22_07895 [Clostridium sp. C8]
MNLEFLNDKKRKILDNINYAKNSDINKVSAILMCNDEEVQKELLAWLALEGYKVSLIKDEINILTIEW